MSGILVVNPDKDQRKSVADSLAARGRRVGTAASIEESLKALAREDYEHVVSIRTLPDGSGELLVQQAAEVSPRTRVLLVTNFSEVRGASDILRFDFTDYIMDVEGLSGLLTGSNRGPGPTQRGLVECFLRTVEAVVGLVELSSPLSAGNAASSLRLAEGVAREMGLPEERRQEVALSALLHDIGNFTVRAGVLEKKNPLGPEEEEAIRQHTTQGVSLLEHIDYPWKIKPIIRHHHERYDGSGYPDGKKGRAIPVGARILAVVDSYLSMTTRRPHREPMSHDQAIEEIGQNMGGQFDPEVVEAFTSFVKRRAAFAGDLFQVKVMVLQGGNEKLSRMKLQFLREDFKVLSAEGVGQAVEQIHADQVRFLVADITDQWDEALELLDKLQDKIDRSEIDVFFFDAESSRERRVTALDSGAEEVFPADVGTSEVISRMRRILRREEAIRKGATLAREHGGIEGDLGQMSLPELLQMLGLGQKTARVILEAPDCSGAVYLESGRLTHAEAGETEGQDALTRVLGLKSGRFRIVHGVTSSRRSVDRDAMSVLLDCIREMDETAASSSLPAS